MNKIYTLILSVAIAFFTTTQNADAQGWKPNYEGVMLQGFYWDSFADTKWTKLQKQSAEIAEYFDLIWVPQSGYCGDGNQMGYMPLYYFTQSSSFGTEKDLRSMIQSFKDKGVGVIADVVLNHHGTFPNTWFGFPQETYNGVTYQFTSTDVVKNDDGGAALTYANANGYELSQNNDTGEGWDGARDLDHKSSNVDNYIKAYVKYLIQDLGYTGFRYDMVKGYTASFTAEYNNYANPEFSVGECWDGTTTIKNWIDGTKVDGVPTSAAFDFQFRYRVRDAINKNDWTLLSAQSEGDAGKPLIFKDDYKQFAVTFVENHDTEKRANATQDPIKADTLAANAYLLAMPGTPCIFLKHWMNAKGDIKRMIAARKLIGINNQSTTATLESKLLCYAVSTQGNNGNLICVVGKTPNAFNPPTGYKLAVQGNDFRYYIPESLSDQWNEIEKKIQEEQKEDDDFTPHTATVYVRDENQWSNVNFYIWDSNNNTQLNGNWPGKEITDTKEINGYTWHYQFFDINSSNYYINLVFSTNSGYPQTVDVLDVREDKFFIITSQKLGDKYLVEEDEETAAVNNILNDNNLSGKNQFFSIDGRILDNVSAPGIYIIKNANSTKKVIIK